MEKGQQPQPEKSKLQKAGQTLALGASLAMVASGAIAEEVKGRLAKLKAEHGGNPKVQKLLEQAETNPAVYKVLDEGAKCVGFSDDKKENFRIGMFCRKLNHEIDIFNLEKEGEEIFERTIQKIEDAVAKN